MFMKNITLFHVKKFLIVYLFSSSCIVPISGFAGERSIRHEIEGGLIWFGEVSNYLNYVSQDEENPAKSESFEKHPHVITGTYTLFFSPIVPQANLPLSLWDFYQRPGKIRLSFAFQPKSTITDIHDDPMLGYHRHTDIHERLRNVHLSLEHYVFSQTGFTFNFDMFRNDDTRRTYTSIGSTHTHKTGDNEGLRRKYGVGISHYLTDNFNLRIGYAFMDGEYRSRERGWAEETPTLVTRYYDDSELTGNHFSLQGHGIFRNFLGIQGTYEFQSYHLEADYLPIPPPDFAGESILSDDELAQHNFGIEFSLYVGRKTTVRMENTWVTETIQRTYKDLQQEIDYDCRYFILHAGFEHYITYAFGIRIGYDYVHRGGDVRIGARDEASPSGTYETKLRRHAVTIGVIGHF